MFQQALRKLFKKSLITTMTCACLAPLWLATPVPAQTVDDVDIGPEVILEDRYPERRFVFANGVTSLADVVFATHAGYRPLTLDLYLPESAGSNEEHYPLVVIVHGGGWQSGHTRHSGAFSNWPAALASIANEGYVVASVEYRLSGEAPYPAAFDDVRDAIRWIRGNAARYHLDESRALIMGGSAGGQLAALVGTACGNNVYPVSGTESEFAAESACVQGVITWYGVFDFGAIVPVGDRPTDRAVAEVLGRYLDCAPTHCDEDLVRSASAISWVDSADPPFLMIHGVDDPVVSVDQSRAMHEALQKANVPSTLIEIPDVGHSFIGTAAETTINASQRAWDASIAFIRQTLGGKKGK